MATQKRATKIDAAIDYNRAMLKNLTREIIKLEARRDAISESIVALEQIKEDKLLR